MPFESKAQARWAFATKKKFAKDWAKKTDYKKIPEKKASAGNVLAFFEALLPKTAAEGDEFRTIKDYTGKDQKIPISLVGKPLIGDEFMDPTKMKQKEETRLTSAKRAGPQSINKELGRLAEETNMATAEGQEEVMDGVNLSKGSSTIGNKLNKQRMGKK